MQNDSLADSADDKYSLTAKTIFQGDARIVIEECSWNVIDGVESTIMFLNRSQAESLIADLKREVKICKSFEKWQAKNCTDRI